MHSVLEKKFWKYSPVCHNFFKQFFCCLRGLQFAWTFTPGRTTKIRRFIHQKTFAQPFVQLTDRFHNEFWSFLNENFIDSEYIMCCKEVYFVKFLFDAIFSSITFLQKEK